MVVYEKILTKKCFFSENIKIATCEKWRKYSDIKNYLREEIQLFDVQFYCINF